MLISNKLNLFLNATIQLQRKMLCMDSDNLICVVTEEEINYWIALHPFYISHSFENQNEPDQDWSTEQIEEPWKSRIVLTLVRRINLNEHQIKEHAIANHHLWAILNTFTMLYTQEIAPTMQVFAQMESITTDHITYHIEWINGYGS